MTLHDKEQWKGYPNNIDWTTFHRENKNMQSHPETLERSQLDHQLIEIIRNCPMVQTLKVC